MIRLFLAVLFATILAGMPLDDRQLLAQETPTPEPTETPVPTDTPIPTDTSVPTEAAEPTETPAPTATAEATPTPTPDEADGDDDVPWLLIILGGIAGALLLLLLGVLLTRRGPAGTAALWRGRATDTYGRAAAAHDAISMELANDTPAADDPLARQRWQELGRRLDNLAAELHALSANPPTRELESAVNRLLAALHALRGAVSAEGPPQAPPQPPQQLAALIRQRLSELDAEVRHLRELL